MKNYLAQKSQAKVWILDLDNSFSQANFSTRLMFDSFVDLGGFPKPFKGSECSFWVYIKNVLNFLFPQIYHAAYQSHELSHFLGVLACKLKLSSHFLLTFGSSDAPCQKCVLKLVVPQLSKRMMKKKYTSLHGDSFCIAKCKGKWTKKKSCLRLSYTWGI